MENEILSIKEKVGYGMGDAASHIIFDNVMLYMMFFYTDIFGIPAGFVGTMFLLARALDAISDPCMGLLADRTRSRWGNGPGCCLAHCHLASSVCWPTARRISV